VYSLEATADMLLYMLPRAMLTLAAAALLPVTLALQEQQMSMLKLIVEKSPAPAKGVRWRP
jgi:hypothetical protein